MALTFATWNIHSAVGTDGRFSLERVASVLRELDADVIALQEVCDFRGRTPCTEHATRLGEALGLAVAFAPTVERAGRRYGDALLARRRFVETKTVDLSVAPWEPRAALIARLEGAGPLAVACIHLGLL